MSDQKQPPRFSPAFELLAKFTQEQESTEKKESEREKDASL